MRLRFWLAAILLALVALPSAAQPSFRAVPKAFAGREARLGDGLDEPFTGVLTSEKTVTSGGSRIYAGGYAAAYAYNSLDGQQTVLSAFVVATGIQSDPVSVHIHHGEAGTNGPVLFTASDVVVTDDGIEAEFGETPSDAQLALLRAGALYVDVHTPRGEIRAQLEASSVLSSVRAQGAGATVSALAYVARARGRQIYLNDDTGGLAIIAFNGPLFEAIQSGAVRQGTVVRVTGTLSEFGGTLQIVSSEFGTNGLDSFEIAIPLVQLQA